jgi:hypothetical protein
MPPYGPKRYEEMKANAQTKMQCINSNSSAPSNKMRLNDNTVSLAVDSNAVQPLRDRYIWVSIDVVESFFIVDYHGPPIDREYASREDVWGKSNELNAGCENLVVGGDGGAEEEVFERNVDTIAGDSGLGIGAGDVVCKGEG